jgi:hypothetical protein
MDVSPPGPAAERTQSTLLVCMAALLLTGFGLQLLLWSRQWVYGDQYALLLSAIRYLGSGELAPFTKEMSGGGRIVGGLLQILIAWPLRLWADFRAPALAMGLTQVGAVAVLMAVLGAAYDRRFVVFFLAAYWLSPWRLYHAGALWEPGFLFLPAALHMAAAWLLRAPPDGNRLEVNGNGREAAHGTATTIGASLLLGMVLVATSQLHASFVVLVVATALLWRQGLIRINFFGFVAGAIAGGLSLAPTVAAILDGEMPEVAPAIDQRVALPVLIVSNVGKAVMYWFRMGSADIGRRLRQTAWLSDTPAGTEAAVWLPSSLVVAVSLLSIVSVLIALDANRRYFRRDAISGRAGADWVRRYALVMLGAVAVLAAVSPVPLQGWHVVIALHAASIPTAAWLDRAFARGGAQRVLGAVLIVLLAATSLLVGLGHPTYLRPDAVHEALQDLPEELRPLISPR